MLPSEDSPSFVPLVCHKFASMGMRRPYDMLFPLNHGIMSSFKVMSLSNICLDLSMMIHYKILIIVPGAAGNIDANVMDIKSWGCQYSHPYYYQGVS